VIKFFPYTFNRLNRKLLFSNDAGDFFLSSADFLDHIMNENLTEQDTAYLLRKGFAYQETHDLYYNSFLCRLSQRKSFNKQISYIIAVPTLRCDLKCDYCQVSRADLGAKGFDWSPEIVAAFEDFLIQQKENKLKIEFQGGEPTVRLDIIQEIVEFCDDNNIQAEYIICTNLSTLSDDLKKLLERTDVYISTSIDGSLDTHTKYRTKDTAISSKVAGNYQLVKALYGDSKINALPTIAAQDFETIRSLIDHYIEMGQKNIFLRPINYQGFARKKFTESNKQYQSWLVNYRRALEYIFKYNFTAEHPITEVGFEVVAKRIFTPTHNSHVDLRSPNFAGVDYIVVNYDGALYPSDEARMLSRIGHVDLCIGNILTGVNKEKLNDFNWNQLNEIHEDCLHCAYKPFCGIDSIDDLSRYDRIDSIKRETHFCATQTNLFNFVFEQLENASPVALYNFQGHLTGDFSLDPITASWIHD